MNQKIRSRRVAALSRLKEQLRKGFKTVRAGLEEGRPINSSEPLSEKDITRITKEIETLEAKI